MAWASITGTKIQDASGNLLAHGEISFQPTDGKGNPIPALAASGGLMIEASSAAITTGVIASGYQVSPSGESAPLNLNYTVTITDCTTGASVVLVGVTVPDGGINFDTFDPSLQLPTIPQVLVTPVTSSTPLPSGTTATTNGVDDNTAKVATDAFVLAQAASANPLVDGSVSVGTSTRFARADHVHPIISASALTTGNLPIAQIPTGGSSSTYLRGDGNWGTPTGAGNVTGPSSSVAGDYAIFSSTTGEVIADGGQPTMRNRIINGDMRIDQRNSGGSVTPTTTGTYLVDRWVYQLSQASKFTIGQNYDALTPPVGFTNYLGFSAAGATVGSGDYFSVGQFIEGLNVADLAWGTANAQSITLSFWTRSSLTGTFGGSIRNGAANRSYPFTYTIGTADTWTKISVTIAGDTTGTWATDNTSGLEVFFGLGVGSNLSGTAGSWAAANCLSATGAVSVVASSGNRWYVTAVQLEAGTVATPFERRLYGLELALAQRYYYRRVSTGTADYIGMLQAQSSSSPFGTVFDLPVEMRTSPTVNISSPTHVSAYNATGTSGAAFTGAASWQASTRSLAIGGGFTGGSGLVAGNASVIYFMGVFT